VKTRFQILLSKCNLRRCDMVLMLFQSKFTNAATMRADVPHGGTVRHVECS
jgi:hypothetical protein